LGKDLVPGLKRADRAETGAQVLSGPLVAETVEVLVGERPIPHGKYSQSLSCSAFRKPAQDACGLHDAEKVALERVDPGALQRV